MAHNIKDNEKTLQELYDSRALDVQPPQQHSGARRGRAKTTARKSTAGKAPRRSAHDSPSKRDSSSEEGEIVESPRQEQEEEDDRKPAARNGDDEDDEDDSSSGSPLFPDPPASPPSVARDPSIDSRAETPPPSEAELARRGREWAIEAIHLAPTDHHLSIEWYPLLPSAAFAQGLHVDRARPDNWEPTGYQNITDLYRWPANQVLEDSSPAEVIWPIEAVRDFGRIENQEALFFSTQGPIDKSPTFYQYVLHYYGYFPTPVLSNIEKDDLHDSANRAKTALLTRIQDNLFKDYKKDCVDFAIWLAIGDVRSQVIIDQVSLQVPDKEVYEVVSSQDEAHLFLRAYHNSILNPGESITYRRVTNRLSFAIERRRREARLRIALGTLILTEFGEFSGLGPRIGLYYRHFEKRYFSVNNDSERECARLLSTVLVPYLKNKYPTLYFRACPRFTVWKTVNDYNSEHSDV